MYDYQTGEYNLLSHILPAVYHGMAFPVYCTSVFPGAEKYRGVDILYNIVCFLISPFFAINDNVVT